MRGRCFKCGDDQELMRDSPREVLHALTQLASPLEIKVPIRCTKCGREVGANQMRSVTVHVVSKRSAADCESPHRSEDYPRSKTTHLAAVHLDPAPAVRLAPALDGEGLAWPPWSE